MKRYAIFGGTFDPFTTAHQAITKGVLDLKDDEGKPFIDKLFVAPTIVNYYRKCKDAWLTDEQKVDVINAMLNGLERSNDWELWLDDFRLKNICKTSAAKHAFVEGRRFINTLLSFKAAMCHDADDEVYVVIGSDSYFNFKSWYMHTEILEQAKLIVVPGRYADDEKRIRENGDIPFSRIVQIDDDLKDMSGSAMRYKYKAGNVSKVEAFSMYMKDVAVPAGSGNELILHTPIFDVVKGVKTSTGLKPIKIDAPDWVSIMVEKDGKLLVEKQFRYGANDYVEEFPCGMVEEDEDPLDAVVRELEEETGIKLLDKNNVIKLGQTNPNPAFMTNTMHYFYVNLDYAEWIQNEQKLDEHEELECYWKDKKRFMFDLADDAHACGKKQVPAIVLSMVKLYENSFNYLSCGG